MISAGQVVNVIVARGAVNTIVWLAVVIALVAVADAALSLLTRWYSGGTPTCARSAPDASGHCRPTRRLSS
jgi:hypothetical protein